MQHILYAATIDRLKIVPHDVRIQSPFFTNVLIVFIFNILLQKVIFSAIYGFGNAEHFESSSS
jgi:hypothetical protein